MTEVKGNWRVRKTVPQPCHPAIYITLSIIKFSLSLYSNGCIVTDVHSTEQKLTGKESIPNNRIESILNQKP